MNSDAFCHKIKLWISCFGHDNEVDSVMKDWWWMTSLQEYLKALCFYLALLMTALLCQLQFVFCRGNFLTTTETTVTWTVVSFTAVRAGVTQHSDGECCDSGPSSCEGDYLNPDMTSRPIQKPRPFSSLTCGHLHWAWLKWDNRATECEEDRWCEVKWELRIPFYSF